MRRRSSLKPVGRHPSGKHPSGKRPLRGPKQGPSTSPNRYQAPAMPPTLVAEVVSIGAHLMAKLLHKELHETPWAIQQPCALPLAAGQFFAATPHPTAHRTLVAEHLIAPHRAATEAALANHAVPRDFEPEALQEAEELKAFKHKATHNAAREDWRSLPIITIDGEDAKDYDDAVWAEPWLEEGKAKGHHVRVAIADVAHYVKPNSALEAAAWQRGNSTYCPVHVVPMLPERLSNNLCSLVPQAERPVLAAEMWLTEGGEMAHYRFCRATIFSAARCTYTQVQQALEGMPHPFSIEVLQNIKNLNAAFEALLQARTLRGAISLEVPELVLNFNTQGEVVGATPRPRLIAHMLIEELMIAANVACAMALTKGCADTRPSKPKKHKGVGGIFRIHAPPSREKLENLKQILAPMGFTAPAPTARPAAWAALATRVQKHPAAPTLQRALLQAQMQAQYSGENIGHFGLALPLYTHFTSPIRRASDLWAHRAILAILGEEDAPTHAPHNIERLCQGFNITERRSQQAEWEARDRLLAGFMAKRVGEVMTATITNVAPFGCFVLLEGGLAEALLPKWHLEDYSFIGGQNAFRKVRGGKGVLRVGERLPVKLLHADFAAGRLTVGLEHGSEAEGPSSRPLTRAPKRR